MGHGSSEVTGPEEDGELVSLVRLVDYVAYQRTAKSWSETCHVLCKSVRTVVSIDNNES